jgi:hypothetical protein
MQLSTTPAAPQSASRPIQEAPVPAAYLALDPRYHYYAVIGTTEYAHHYTATFHDAEGAYCELSASPAGVVQNNGCGFPASLMQEDHVPNEQRDWLDALKAAVTAQEPNARRIRVRYTGTYRTVTVQEATPCPAPNGAGTIHGHGYMTVDFRYNEHFTELRGTSLVTGSECGALLYYWAAREPRWLPFTSTTSLLGNLVFRHAFPDELMPALRKLLANPGADYSAPPPIPASVQDLPMELPKH